MCDKMAISADILKIVENDPFLGLQMTTKEMFNRKSEELPMACFHLKFSLGYGYPHPLFV